ncbi:M10 family metallopeptidase C-terminal domain-containing protein [Ramlibacter sp. PS3R-8]|uniref:calcium-binding protein n=1 Tax=Ramlibacter sp. PS3R-8 TaxID=3133437 RepID=UPI0030A1DF83
MAKLQATRAIDYSQLDLSGLRTANDSGFDDNLNVNYNGIVYQDILWFEEGPDNTAFGGTGFTMQADAVTGGTVTGVLTEVWTGSAWAMDWVLEGVNVSAVSLYRAALTASTADDMSIVTTAMSGADTFLLSRFADKMRGFGGNDLMKGMNGNDVLSGDGGNDTLVGGAGADRLTGNAGADVFDYNLATESGLRTSDLITDFVRGVDRIDLSGIDANSATATNQAFTGFIRAGADFTRAGQLRFVDGVLMGNTDSDAAAEFAIVLNGVNALSVADLVL